eukprot:CAMPEP_0184989596 /NCGR_PEP_ID=MMETSP1098-20130426/29127_1 /TAXON_ID=89044 /ORGANISM="Spumella elongata, Strain CCAP 955/1" /LENGTH=114 /DNA_ID=CAMNT_0027514625 /DNA_START=22 /DNA_END=366 /DNA_ORIENTATION=-
MAYGAGVGAVVGGATVMVAFYAVGLTSRGPVSRGVFANNMGSGLVSGTRATRLQSTAMTSGVYIMGACIGAVIGATRSFPSADELMHFIRSDLFTELPTEEEIVIGDNYAGLDG